MKSGQATETEVDGTDMRFAVVAARFHGELVEALLEGAMGRLRRAGVRSSSIQVSRVPGAFEIAQALQWLAEKKRYDALIGLGVVIRGDTPHFDYICSACADGCQQVALEHGVPVAFGVLTCDTEEQAKARCGGKVGNKGDEAALAALEMAALRKKLLAGKETD